MYLALRAYSFCCKLVGGSLAIFGVGVYIISFFAPEIASSLVGFFGAGALSALRTLGFFWLLGWLFVCLGSYALGQFIDLMMSIERNIREPRKASQYRSVPAPPASMWDAG